MGIQFSKPLSSQGLFKAISFTPNKYFKYTQECKVKITCIYHGECVNIIQVERKNIPTQVNFVLLATTTIFFL